MNMGNEVSMKEMNEWYKDSILSRVGNVHVENEGYIIEPFQDCESIKIEASELNHALYHFIKGSYLKGTITFYPLYLRHKDSPQTPYCSVGIVVENGTVRIMSGPGDMEEAVLKYNALLKNENEQAYVFLKSNLEEIGKQMCMEEN